METSSLSHLFVVTYGRSGSTLLMGYLNRLPGVCIRGENNGALIDLWRCVRRIEQGKTMTGKEPPEAPTHPWYGIDSVDAGAFARALANTFSREVLRPPKDARVAGFKEIRYDEQSIPDLDDFLSFLLESFEDPHIIFNVRDASATARSKWWRKSWGAQREIKRLRNRFETSRHATDARCATCRYESFIADPAEAERIATFVGAPFDPEAWRETLGTRHSY